MRAYASYALDYPNELKFVAVAEPDEGRREEFQKSTIFRKSIVMKLKSAQPKMTSINTALWIICIMNRWWKRQKKGIIYYVKNL